MTKEDLKALGLTDEQVGKIVEDYGKNYVAKTQFNAKNEELKALKGEVKTLKEENAEKTTLKEQFEQLKAQAEEQKGAYEQQINQIKLNNAIEGVIRGAKGRSVKAVKALLNLENVKLNGDKLEGLDEQLQELQANQAWLFDNGEITVKGVEPATPPAKTNAGLTKNDFERMSYTEQAELYSKNKTLYEELTK